MIEATNKKMKNNWYIDSMIAKMEWKSILTASTYISSRLAISVKLNILVIIYILFTVNK